MADFADPAIRKQVCQCSAQSTKTVTMYACMGYALLEDPGPFLWATKSQPEAKKIAAAYVWPFFENTPRLSEKLPTQRDRKRKLGVDFGGYYFNIVGADAEGSLQTLPYRYLFLDEIRQWKAGRLEMAQKRTRSYPHNHKQFLVSCPDMQEDAMDRAFLNGSQEHWHVPCRSCGHLQELAWGEKKKPGGIKWDTNEVTCPNGLWDYDEVCKTLRYECEACGHEHRDIRPSGSDRKHFCREGQWVAYNPLAPSDYKSYTWNALLPHFTSWDDQLKEFLTAMNALKNGDFTPLKDHWTETRGLPWADRMRFAKEDTFLSDRERDYRPGDPWEYQIRRVMTIDVQAKGGRHYYVVIRDWGHYGRSRKIHHERVYTKDDLFRLQKEFNVDPRNVGVDSAYSSAEVYKLVVESGNLWKAMRGEEKQFFTQDQGRKAIWAMSKMDPALGTAMQGRVQELPLWLFSAPATRERLVMMMYGELGDWQLPLNEDDVYKRMVTAWERKAVPGRNGAVTYIWYRKCTDDHYEACERMQIAIAAITGLFESQGGTIPLPLG